MVDEQAAADATPSVIIALASGINLAHEVGYLESGLTTSPEMLVFTVEMMGTMRRFARGVSLESDSLGLEVIHQVGPGGETFARDHTAARFRDSWKSVVLNRKRFDDWVVDRSRGLRARLSEKTICLMEQGERAVGEADSHA